MTQRFLPIWAYTTYSYLFRTYSYLVFLCYAQSMKKTKFEKEIEVIYKIDEILEWSYKNPWFDTSFIKEMSLQKTFSHAQMLAIENIYERFLCRTKSSQDSL